MGAAKIVPLSRMPRRLTTITNRIAATPSGTRRGSREGNADVIARTPAATLTETVST